MKKDRIPLNFWNRSSFNTKAMDLRKLLFFFTLSTLEEDFLRAIESIETVKEQKR